MNTGYFENNIHYLTSRIYYYNTDAGGVVYHGRYLDICEIARTEMIDSIVKINPDDYKTMSTVVRSLSVEYKKPALLYDIITTKTQIMEVKGASVKIKQTILRDSIELVIVNLVIAFVDLTKMVACRIPEDVQILLKKFISH